MISAVCSYKKESNNTTVNLQSREYLIHYSLVRYLKVMKHYIFRILMRFCHAEDEASDDNHNLRADWFTKIELS